MGKPARSIASGNPAVTATTWLTMAEVQHRLGLSRSGVRGHIASDRLHPEKSSTGALEFDSDEVELLAQERGYEPGPPTGRPDGRVDAAAFQLFEGGASIVAAVIALRQPVGIVQRLWEQYLDVRRSMPLSRQQVIALGVLLDWRWDQDLSGDALVTAARAKFKAPLPTPAPAPSPANDTSLPLTEADRASLAALDRESQSPR